MIIRELLVRLGVDFDKRSADDAERGVGKLKDAAVALGSAFAASRVYGSLKGLVDEASVAADELNVLKQTFGDYGDGVLDWAKTQADSLGRSQYSLRSYAAQMGAVLVPTLQGNREEAAKMSTSLAGLAVDLGSFFHKADDDTLARLRSGMLGSVEAVDQLGINLHKEALTAEAARMGIKGYNAQSSETIKTQVRFSKILRDTIDKQGWAAKTSAEYDNQVRKLDEDLKTMRIEMGQRLLPAAAGIVSVFSSGVTWFKQWSENSSHITAALTVLGATLIAMNAAALLPIIGIALGFGLIYLAVEDLMTALRGGESVIGHFFEALMGKDNWEAVRNAWKTGTETIGNYLWEALNPEEAKKRKEATRSAKEKLLERDAEGRLVTQYRNIPMQSIITGKDGARVTNTEIDATKGEARFVEIFHWMDKYLSKPQWKTDLNKAQEDYKAAHPDAGFQDWSHKKGDLVINVNADVSPETVDRVKRAARELRDQENRVLFNSTAQMPLSPLSR